MQIITEIPDGKPGRPDNQRSRFLKCQPGRDLPKKTEVATGRKRNAFLTGKVSPIAIDYYMENETDETETNLTTSENFDFLYRSALRYAGLMGIKLPFRPRKGGSPRMNIAGLYRAMDEALPEQVNLEEKAGRLYFCLYRFHEWPDYTLFWIPIDFIDEFADENLRTGTVHRPRIHPPVHPAPRIEHGQGNMVLRTGTGRTA
mgnify:CR=1 FL=1